MTNFDQLSIQVDGGQCYHPTMWSDAIKHFVKHCAKFGGNICFGADEAGFALSLIWEHDDCEIVVWSRDIAPRGNTLLGITFHSTSEWPEVVDSLKQFCDNEHIKMLVITDRWNPIHELRLWKKDDRTLGIAGTYPGR